MHASIRSWFVGGVRSLFNQRAGLIVCMYLTGLTGLLFFSFLPTPSFIAERSSLRICGAGEHRF